MNLIRLALPIAVACALTACDHETSIAQHGAYSIAEVQSMTLRPDGSYDVLCTDGGAEVASLSEILDGEVCMGSTLYGQAKARFESAAPLTVIDIADQPPGQPIHGFPHRCYSKHTPNHESWPRIGSSIHVTLDPVVGFDESYYQLTWQPQEGPFSFTFRMLDLVVEPDGRVTWEPETDIESLETRVFFELGERYFVDRIVFAASDEYQRRETFCYYEAQLP